MICKVVQSKMSLIISRCLLRASSQCDWSYAAVNAAAACATAAAAACATAAAASSQNCRKMSSSVGRTDQPGTFREFVIVENIRQAIVGKILSQCLELGFLGCTGTQKSSFFLSHPADI